MTTRSAKPPKANPASVLRNGGNVLARCLSLDLEVGRADERIHALAGVRPDTGQSLVIPRVGNNLAQTLAQLDDLANGADFLLGHNLIAFDLPHLRAANPRLRLLDLPAVDTLRLNPLAFPRNPYHHLVKHYQDGSLIPGRRNDPELDARLTLEVFDNQQKAFREARAELLTAWHWLTAAEDGAGFDQFFAFLRASPRPSDAEAPDAIHRCLAGSACRAGARAAVMDAAQQGWEFAYALAWLSVAGGSSVMPPWVRHQFPGAGRLVRRLRDNSCSDPDCDWCRERHDVRRELSRWFGFDDFRPEPAGEDGRPLQRDIVEAAMAGEHALVILPTGSGKSLCYQLPPLSRYDKTGALTVVISPLVALMADQVAGPGVTRHRFMRHRQLAPVHAGACQRAGAGAPGRRRHPDHLSGAAAKRVPAAGPGPTGDRVLGAGRSPLPLQVGARLPARLPLCGTVHSGEGRTGSYSTGLMPDRHCQA